MRNVNPFRVLYTILHTVIVSFMWFFAYKVTSNPLATMPIDFVILGMSTVTTGIAIGTVKLAWTSEDWD